MNRNIYKTLQNNDAKNFNTPGTLKKFEAAYRIICVQIVLLKLFDI